MLNLNMKNLKVILPLLNLFIGTFLVVVYSFVDHIIFKEEISKVNIEKISNKIIEREEYFSDQVKSARSILIEFRDNQLFDNYLDEKSDSKKHLEHLFENIIKLNSSIMQIRFIDRKGFEKIRFDRVSHDSDDIKYIEALQNKSNRYYFTQNIKNVEKVWYSALDLNIEQGKVEIPYNPTYRAVLPVVHKGEFDGMIVINYFAETLFEKLFFTPLFDAVLIDKQGYILKHHNSKKDWSRYAHKQFKIDEPYLIHITQESFIGKDYVMKKLDLPFQNDLFLILKLSEENLKQQEVVYYKRTAILIVTFTLLIFLVSLILFIILRKYEMEKQQVVKLNETTVQQEEILKQKSKMASMGEMIANIAHQWRQPLTLLAYYTINLERKVDKGKVTKEFLENYVSDVNVAIENMDKTLEDFSGFFKPNKEKTKIDLNRLIKNSLGFIEKSLLNYNIDFEFKESKEYICYGYKNELFQVLLNIFINSKDAIILNNIQHGKIRIDISEKDDKFVINIEDNGGGIKKEYLGKLFEPYFTTKEESEGIGIGLYMCKIIIENSFDGRITLENKNDGALCVIELLKG